MWLFFLGVALMLASAPVAYARRKARGGDRLFLVTAVAGCVVVALVALRVLAGGASAGMAVPAALPGGAWEFGIDPLSAFFLLCITLTGSAAVGFGAAYLAPERVHRPVWFAHATLGVLLAALSLVVTAQSVVPFLGAWEIMAISAYFLIVTDHREAGVRRAGLLYLICTHTGTLVLFAMFAAWAPENAEWSFRALAAASDVLPGSAANAMILALAVAGFGFKAGFVPLHFWLPPAHAAAPAHVSALLSGVMIKTGIYGILRVVSLTGTPPAWWGWMILTIGAVSAVLGVLWALAQHDLKRLLAYHSVENIGIIAMGIGVGALGGAYGRPFVSILGYAGAVLHTLNHALFKSLLFLGAGVVQRAAGTRHIDALGGLARRLPYTWIGFLIGATAIIGLPPLNGFVSEWLVYVGLLGAAQGDDALRVAALGVPVLALVGALALACFAKVAGVVFLGTARSAFAARAREVERALYGPMLALAAACVVLGVVPALGVTPAVTVAAAIARLSPTLAAQGAVIGAQATRIGVIAALLVLVVGGLALLRRATLRSLRREAETWACGYPLQTPRMQYTASSFAAPLVDAFAGISGVEQHRSAGHFATHPFDPVLDRTVTPVWHRLHRLALRLRPIQQGRLFVYLIYVMAALLVLLAWLALAR